jgi:rhodanese-related sulfurtransferase
MSPIAGLGIVAAVATFGDFIWYTVGVRHTVTAGIVHGALLLTAVGGVLGASHGRIARGLPIGALAGVGGALSYYLIVVVTGSPTYGPAIPAAWVIMWLLLAGLEGRWLRTPDFRNWREIATRGAIAAVAGGLAFALVRHILWGRPPGAERSYVVQFLAWSFAWAPGLLALTWDRSPAQAGGPSILPADLAERIDRGETLQILDVRSEGEFASGHVPGAVNIPFNRVLAGESSLPGSPDQELFLYCGHGPRAYMAAAALRKRGRTRIVYVSGHFSGWRHAGLRVEN